MAKASAGEPEIRFFNTILQQTISGSYDAHRISLDGLTEA
jgi:hypothetical protein